jgi:hypothetical protein
MKSVRRKNENKKFMIFFDITKKCYKLMYRQYEDLCHCIISIFRQDLMISSLKINK